MTLSMCDQVAERLALGESLGELAEHAQTCASCRDLVAVSNQLSATRHEVDPGLGFAARMTVGAQHRIVARRRRRVAAGLAATVMAGGFGVFVATHTPQVEPPPVATRVTPAPTTETDPEDLTPADTDLATLAQLADVDNSLRLSADWRHIKKPLAPYKKLQKMLEGETP